MFRIRIRAEIVDPDLCLFGKHCLKPDRCLVDGGGGGDDAPGCAQLRRGAQRHLRDHQAEDRPPGKTSVSDPGILTGWDPDLQGLKNVFNRVESYSTGRFTYESTMSIRHMTTAYSDKLIHKIFMDPHPRSGSVYF